MNKYYEAVEKVLSRYPISWSKNYYQNKKNLIIEYKEAEMKSVSAWYSHEENIMTIFDSNIDASPHELFHMAFRDKEKVEKEYDKDTIYGNGVSLKNVAKNIIIFKGMTEGFAEYLSRLCNTSVGHCTEYFFTDLLISIYGEEILEYPLKNDPIGFLSYDRFYDLFRFLNYLEDYSKSTEEIQIMSYLKEELMSIGDTNEKAKKEIFDIMNFRIEKFNKSIIGLFEAIIKEYKSCKNPTIEKELFIKKLASFLTDPDYAVNFMLYESDFGVRKTIQKKIDSLSRHSIF